MFLFACYVCIIPMFCINAFVQLTSLYLDDAGHIRIADFRVNARYCLKTVYVEHC